MKKKCPEIIKPIYQTENQYSKAISVMNKYQIPRAQGKYIALCEGDDYWIDEYKLQTQYDILETHPNIDMCSHGAIIINEVTGEHKNWELPYNQDVILSLKEVVEGGGGLLPTASLFYRRYLEEHKPDVFDWCKPDDIEYQMAENILPLPIHQRYGLDDMEYIVDQIMN